MPLYDFKCRHGHTCELQRPIAQRHDPGEGCPTCGEELKLQISLVATAEGRIRGDKRIIRDERQVIAEKGRNWRDAGTTGKEGGIGRKKHFT